MLFLIKKRLAFLLSEKASEARAYDSFISLFSDQEIEKQFGLLPGKVCSAYNNRAIHNEIAHRNFNSWLPDYILPRLDRMTMANSIEARVPFLDHHVVDYTFSSGGTANHANKALLKRMMNKKIPKAILKRKKFPFYIPITNWFDKGLKDYYSGIMDKSKLIEDKILQRSYTDKIIDSHNKSPLINSRKLWSLMTLEACYSSMLP